MFGVGCRNEGYEARRSDVMMVLSYNSNQNKASITSLVGDTYVEILDYGFTRLNHAYAYGGSAKTIQTLTITFTWTSRIILPLISGQPKRLLMLPVG